jgi:uncharacterized protein YeaO (DUF488 family)
VIRMKSAYLKPAPEDGYRVLVASQWPVGLPKGKASAVDWIRSLDPSANLRDWMRRNPRKIDSFRHKYLAELARNDAAIAKICAKHKELGFVTVVYVPDAEGAWPVAETLTAFISATCDAG